MRWWTADNCKKESALRVHLVPRLGTKRLDEISNEDVQRLNAAEEGRRAGRLGALLGLRQLSAVDRVGAGS